MLSECVLTTVVLMFVAGLIRLRSSPPPHLQGVEYVLNITATDDNASGGPQALSSTAQVIVGVDDVNNNKPVFEKVRRHTPTLNIKPCLALLHYPLVLLSWLPCHFLFFFLISLIYLNDFSLYHFLYKFSFSVSICLPCTLLHHSFVSLPLSVYVLSLLASISPLWRSD